MSKIKFFKEEDELHKFFINNTVSLIGEGSEGACYRGKDGYAYKEIYNRCYNGEYYIDKIITRDEIDLPSFAFPEEVYAIDNVVRGYKTILVENDLFRCSNTCDIATIDTIDFKKLSKAYYNMATDVLLLSDYGVLIDDLPFNVIFDGDKLTAIDTCGYKHVDFNPRRDNLKSLNCSIELLFTMWFEVYKKMEKEIHGMDIDTYLDEVYNELPLIIKHKIKAKNKNKEKVKVMKR